MLNFYIYMYLEKGNIKIKETMSLTKSDFYLQF
jgi:hypothetical protein